jgi:hypothetical protein
MPDNPSKLGALLTWAGGILASIIAGVAIYYFTRPVPPPPPTQVGLNGFVQNVVTQQPVADAIVTADVGNALGSQHTDSEGRYAFSVSSTAPLAQVVNIDVLAGGYVHYTNSVPIASTGITFAGVQLQPDAAPVEPPAAGQSAAGQPAGAHPAAPVQPLPKPRLILHIPANYAVRADTAALKPK